jgi:hypothetical protein
MRLSRHNRRQKQSDSQGKKNTRVESAKLQTNIERPTKSSEKQKTLLHGFVSRVTEKRRSHGAAKTAAPTLILYLVWSYFKLCTVSLNGVPLRGLSFGSM